MEDFALGGSRRESERYAEHQSADFVIFVKADARGGGGGVKPGEKGPWTTSAGMQVLRPEELDSAGKLREQGGRFF